MPVFLRHNGVDHSGGDMAGMDHSGMDMGGSSASGVTTPSMSGHSSMQMYVHGSIGGDVLWFASWQPTSAGATVGVCIGLFLLAIFDRYVHALSRACSHAWSRGRVGFALPVASGDLPPPQPQPSSDPSTATTTAAAAGLSTTTAATRRTPAVTTAPGAPVPAAPPSMGSEVNEKAALAAADASVAVVAKDSCDCGCGGECGGTSAQAGCCGTGTCAPDYEEEEDEQTTSTPASNEKQTLAYLPPSVRSTLDPARQGRWSRPLRWGIDIPRGLLYMLLMTIHFALMLVIMTFQIWWIISVIVGLGVGEALFGRFGASRV